MKLLRSNRKTARSAHRQRGMTLMVVLVFALVIAIAVLVSLRGVLQDSLSAGAMAQRNEALAADDSALQQLKAQVDAATASGQELEIVQPAWLDTAKIAPDASFWAQCLASGTQCTALSSLPAGYSAWGTVQATGSTMPQGCPSSQYAAVPYVLNVYVKDAKGVSSAAQAIYTKCFLADQS